MPPPLAHWPVYQVAQRGMLSNGRSKGGAVCRRNRVREIRLRPEDEWKPIPDRTSRGWRLFNRVENMA